MTRLGAKPTFSTIISTGSGGVNSVDGYDDAEEYDLEGHYV